MQLSLSLIKMGWWALIKTFRCSSIDVAFAVGAEHTLLSSRAGFLLFFGISGKVTLNKLGTAGEKMLHMAQAENEG